MLRKRITGLLTLFRFELPFTAGVCVLLGELLALGRLPGGWEAFLGFSSVFCISAAALILNDYFDIESDRINAPERPLPSGLVTKRDVVLLTIAVTLLGLLAGAFISGTVLITTAVVWLIGFLYNWRFKRTGFIGNLMVSFSVGMTFIVGGMAVQQPFSTLVCFFALWVALIDLAEEIAADAMDVEGDRLKGSRSLAVRLGSENALRISAGIFLLVVLGSGAPFLLGWLEWHYLPPILLTDVVIVHSVWKLLDARIANRRPYIRRIYLSGLVTLMLFIIIRMFMRNETVSL